MRKITGGQTEMNSNDVKRENDPNSMDSSVFGLIEDIFLVNEFSPNFSDNMGATPPLSSMDDDMKELMTPADTEMKPFEAFEKQITISVPQPPPLKAEAFTIGGGLFHGMINQILNFIVDQTNSILILCNFRHH